MISSNTFRRACAAAAVIATGGLPAAAQARFNLEPAGAAGSPAPATQSPPPSASRVTAAADPGFQWGDAGIGAAGTVLLLGGGALIYAAPRRSRRGARAV